VVSRKSKTRRGKEKDRDRARAADDGAVDIARAERKLASALANVEAARDKLARRERELSDLLQRHGRPPAPEPDETTPPDYDTEMSSFSDETVASQFDSAVAATDGDGPDGVES
jgi:outer membrane protein TolC